MPDPGTGGGGTPRDEADPRSPAWRHLSPEQRFLASLDTVEGILAAICRRNCCAQDDAEEFAAWARLRLIEDDYAVLRKFRGRSTLKTYLTTVLHNLFRDYRIKRWGKWRPCARARRLGPVAVQLDSLLHRDGFSLEEAIRILQENFSVSVGRDDLEAVASQLPARRRPTLVGGEALHAVGVDGGVETRALEHETAAGAERAAALLDEALARLGPQERLILRMRYRDGFRVAEIAAALGLRARPLYKRFERCLGRLRAELERAGLEAAQVEKLAGRAGLELRLDWEPTEAGKSSPVSVTKEGRFSK